MEHPDIPDYEIPQIIDGDIPNNLEISDTFQAVESFSRADRIRKLGKSVLSLPQNMYEKAQIFAINAQLEPITYTKYAIEATVIGLEISPVNESLRYAALGWTHTATGGNSVASSIAFGASTFAIEAVAALMAADLLDSHGSKKIIENINSKGERFLHSDDTKKEMSLVSRAATAMLFGSAVLLAAKQRKNPLRNKKENQVSGLKTAATMGAYFAAEGFVTSEAVNHIGWPRTIAGGVLALFGIQKGVSYYADKKNK